MRKIEEQNIRKIFKSHSSYALTLPIAEIRKLGWKENQKLLVERKGSTLLIKDWK